MRPHGDIRMALLKAAEEAPGSVRELAERAQVGYTAARYTASRMLDRDELMVVEEGRPARLSAPNCPAIPPGGETLADALQRLHRSFWDQPELQA